MKQDYEHMLHVFNPPLLLNISHLMRKLKGKNTNLLKISTVEYPPCKNKNKSTNRVPQQDLIQQ